MQADKKQRKHLSHGGSVDRIPRHGEVAEWLNVPDSKFGVGFCPTEGSNPSLSAIYKKRPNRTIGAFFYVASTHKILIYLPRKNRPNSLTNATG